ncbi:hypothetical protein V8G54_027476 [Vigna mungo]|uniref:EF-hand domain-containing protein n=1 Tax=Vigna mungo TaxID=3915 RepID=A0AAQ3N298_VIGMU
MPWEMTDLRWEDDSEDDDEFLERLPQHTFGIELLEVVAPPTLDGTTKSRAVIDSDLGSSHGSTAGGEPWNGFDDDGQAMRPKTRGIFEFGVSLISFNVANDGYLDYAQFEYGLFALQIPPRYKYAKELFNVCDADRDGRIDYRDFRHYMDDKELQLIERNS